MDWTFSRCGISSDMSPYRLTAVFLTAVFRVQEMKENGELEEILPKRISLDDRYVCHCTTTCIHTSRIGMFYSFHSQYRLKSLTNKAPIMLFMKGSPEVSNCVSTTESYSCSFQEPQCGFSRTVCGILQECG